MSFHEIFKDRGNRFIMVGLFLAMLELIRYHLVWVEQSAPAEPIMVSSLTQTPAEQAVHNIIYADQLQEEDELTQDIDPEQTQAVEAPQPILPKTQIPIKEMPAVSKPLPTNIEDVAAKNETNDNAN